MKRGRHEASAALLVLFASGCQSGLPTEVIVDDTPPVIPETHVPPLSGGTLLVTSDGSTAVVSDPERDRLLVVGLAEGAVREIQLEARDEPGRLVEGPTGTVFVALRRGNAIVAVDLASATIEQRSAVCDAPRGMAYDATGGDIPSLHVACASGELVTLDAGTLMETRTLRLGPDLRDVLMRGDELMVTHFRSAELTRLWPNGAVDETLAPWPLGAPPHAAWRTVATANGNVLMVHQRASIAEVDLQPVPAERADPDSGSDSDTGSSSAPYGGECDNQLVQGDLTLFFGSGLDSQGFGSGTMGNLRLPIDLAVSADGDRAVVIDPASHQAREINLHGVLGGGCDTGDQSNAVGEIRGTPVAVAFAGEDVVVQTREPSSLNVFRNGMLADIIQLGGVSRADTGFDLFHNTSDMPNTFGLACASCHPEGRDDGHVWTFSGEGARRTQSLAGTLAGTAPFHWGGNLSTLESLMDEVSTRRMGGVKQSPARIAALQSWLLSLEPLRAAPDPAVDQALVEQGKALFEDETVGCASCHSGPSFTNNRNEDIGRGAALQTPSLIGISMRAPFMHDGCAATLMDRFDPACGGDQHGDTEGLDDAEKAALVAYMNTL